MRRLLLCGMMVISLVAPPALAQPASPPSFMPPTAVLFDADPQAGGNILSVVPLDAPVSQTMQKSAYVALRIGVRRFVFVVARVADAGSPVGSTVVRLRDGDQPLFNTATLLAAALVGKTSLVVLTQGKPEVGIVIAILPWKAGSGLAQISTAGATHATIFHDRQETVAVLGPGRAGGPTLPLDGTEELGCRFCQEMDGTP